MTAGRSAAAQAWLWLVEGEEFVVKHLVRDVAVAALAFAYSVWAIAGAGNDVVTKGFLLLLCGIPVYVAMRWWDRRKAYPVPMEPAVTTNGTRFSTERQSTTVGGNGAR